MGKASARELASDDDMEAGWAQRGQGSAFKRTTEVCGFLLTRIYVYHTHASMRPCVHASMRPCVHASMHDALERTSEVRGWLPRLTPKAGFPRLTPKADSQG